MRNVIATVCLTIAVLVGSAGVSWSADFQKSLTAAQSGDFETALREWTPLAEQGDAKAQYNLGLMYQNGDGVPQDDKTAAKWYRLAAEQGDADAEFHLGLMIITDAVFHRITRLLRSGTPLLLKVDTLTPRLL